MDIRILGPLEIEVGGRQVRLGPQQGAVLAKLLLEAGRVVRRTQLVELLWGEPAPDGATTTLRSHILHLRKVLEPGRKAGGKPEVLVAAGTGEGAGYALRVCPEQVDAFRFERLFEAGRAALAADDPGMALERLTAALALWRGRALADVADRPFAFREIARLEGLRRVARQARIEAGLALGHHAEIVGELEGLVAQRPYDEGLRRHLALALYRSHRQTEAARACQEGLALLHDRGLDSSALEALQRDILRHAPELEWVPVLSGPIRPFQLPPDIAEFGGRKSELAALRARLTSTPARAQVVITAIDGKPGIGKSALAIHIAHQLAPQFEDGVLYVDLRGAEPQRLAPAQVLGQFLRAFGVADEQVPAEVEAASGAYRTVLADKRVLVVLDNAAGASQVRPLIPGSPGCAVLVTSRTPLVDLEGVTPLSLGLLDREEAVSLLGRVGGARRVAAEPAEATAVALHCGLLPLAVRIAGARLRARPAWPVAALARRLADERRRLGELEVGELAVRASFQLSYRGLDAITARMFRLLGLLEGPDVTADVAAALAGVTVFEAGEVLERLVDAQLLETHELDRYRFHDLLRLFARERAETEEDSDERAAVLRRALGWYLATTEQANELLKPTSLRAGDRARSPGSQPFADQQSALKWLEAERANLVAAVKQAAGLAPEPVAATAWRLCNSLFGFFALRKHWSDWQAVAQAAVRAARLAGDRLAEAEPLNSLGVIFFEQRRFDAAIASYEESLAIYRDDGNRTRERMVLNNLGNVYLEQGRLEDATGFFEESLAISLELGNRAGECRVLNNLGIVRSQQGRFTAAREYLTRSIATSREIGDRANEGMALHNLGDVHREEERFDIAIATYERAIAIFRELGARYAEGCALSALGRAVEAVRGVTAARSCWAEALAILTGLGAPQAEETRALLEGSYKIATNSA